MSRYQKGYKGRPEPLDEIKAMEEAAAKAFIEENLLKKRKSYKKLTLSFGYIDPGNKKSSRDEANER